MNLVNMFTRLISVLVIVAVGAAAQSARGRPAVPHPKDELTDIGPNVDESELFGKWMNRYKKNYLSPQERSARFNAFRENVKKVRELNKNAAEHGGKVKFGLTKFADMTPEEFASTILMKDFLSATNSIAEPGSTISDAVHAGPHVLVKREVPEEVDWTKSNIVTPVKDQGDARTCYIFAALAVLESRWAQKGNGLVNLSAEQVADCLAADDSPNRYNLACGVNGGFQQAVFDYVKDKGGISSDEAYPYCVGELHCRPCAPEGYNAYQCDRYPISNCRVEDSCDAKYDASKFVGGLQVQSWKQEPTNEDEIAAVLATKGPISAGVDAADLQLYSEGILMPQRCSSYRTNHAITLVGYGTEDGTKYWKAKNSWGTDHGEDGYLRIVRGQRACGIDRSVISAELV